MLSDRTMPGIPRRNFLKAGAAGVLAMTLGGYACANDNGAKVSTADDGDVFQVVVPLKTPRKMKDKRAGESANTCSFSMFIPRQLKVIRGLTFNPFYEPTVEQKHWRAAACHWGFAHAGANFFGMRAEELGSTLLAGLRELARSIGRAEIEHLPICPLGMSAGAGMATRIVESIPDRCIAAAPVCLEVGPRDAASRRVPMITLFGEKDGKQMDLLEAALPKARAEHALWAIAPQWKRRHEWFRANDLVIPFFHRVIPLRLPTMHSPLSAPVQLKSIDESTGWLGDRSKWRTAAAPIAPFPQYRGDVSQACWLADGYLAAVWQAFVAYESPLSITLPAGMSDGKPLATLPAGRPIGVKVAVRSGVAVRKVQIYDGDKPLSDLSGDKPAGTIPPLAPGIYALIAVASAPDGSRLVSAPNTILVA